MNPWKRLSEHSKLQIIKWSYLAIVIFATITLTVLVNQNKNLVNDIQNDRKRVTFDSCLDQNSRNQELKDFLREEQFKRLKREAIENGKPVPEVVPPLDNSVKKIIDVLAAKRDCDQVVINIFGSPLNDESS
jgi:hypothetical protein